MKNKITAVLFIIVFLLVVAIVCVFLTSWDRGTKEPAANLDPVAAEEGGEPAVVVETPSAPVVVSDTTPIPTSGPTAVPDPNTIPTPIPAATPAPEGGTEATPAPTETPAASNLDPNYPSVSLGSGTFKSDTKTGLNIHADWEARTVSGTQVEVTIKVYADHYTLSTNAIPRSVNIVLDGQYVSLDAPAIKYDGTGSTSTELASRSFIIDLAPGDTRELKLSVEWAYNGRYGGVSLKDIECGGKFELAR